MSDYYALFLDDTQLLGIFSTYEKVTDFIDGFSVGFKELEAKVYKIYKLKIDEPFSNTLIKEIDFKVTPETYVLCSRDCPVFSSESLDEIINYITSHRREHIQIYEKLHSGFLLKGPSYNI